MIQKRIEIYEKDAYRAKTESCFRSDIFFEDVYKRTDAIVCDIIKQMQCYTEDSEKQGGHKSKYQGMGNNIVVFCAERGQGKTSAMQSYAAYLQNKSLAEEGFFEKDNAVSKSCFKVLDPIDPSSLDSGESIVRVLVSRLFLEFSKMVENDEIPFRNELKFRQEKDTILKTFQKCYENIDYLRKERNIEAHDLESLAQLGSSAELKKNLFHLVDCYLDLFFDKKKGVPYLVLQIDDADLSVGDIFKVCDDIRNYFSIPNMIVMMAASYAQLELAVCQRYMRQYEHLTRLQGEEGYVRHCNWLAFCYMEKMFPAEHQVVLPAVDVLINENANSLKVLYYRDKTDGPKKTGDLIEIFELEEGASPEEERCKNIQQQLIKLLYNKTGIVLLEHAGEMHPILPHTLRELTHFIKLLDSMEDINPQEALKIRTGSENYSEFEKWKGNLELFKKYFLNYWCGTYLSYKQQKLIKEIDQVSRKMDSVSRIILKYMSRGNNESALKTDVVTYRNVMKELVEEGLEDHELQYAIFFYYTIVLNEWFVRGIEDPVQLKALAMFVERALDVELKPEAEKDYSILQFGFEMEKMRQYTEGELTNILNSVWLMIFCTDASASDKPELDMERLKKILEDGQMKEEGLSFRFDLFHPILTMLFSDVWVNKDIGSRGEAKEASTEDDSSRRNEQDISTDMSYLISAKNLIVNYDVARWVKAEVQRKINELNSSGERRLDRIWKGFYEIIDSWVEKSSYLGEKSTLGKVCFGPNLENPTIGNVVFLSNDSNRKKYIGEYRDYLKKYIVEGISGKLEEISKMSDSEALEFVIKQMIGDLSAASYKGNIILSVEDRNTNNQFLQKIPGLRELIEIEYQMEQAIKEGCDQLTDAMEKGEAAASLQTRIRDLKKTIREYEIQIKRVKIL